MVALPPDDKEPGFDFDVAWPRIFATTPGVSAATAPFTYVSAYARPLSSFFSHLLTTNIFPLLKSPGSHFARQEQR